MPPTRIAERVGDRADGDAQVAGRLAVDGDLDLGLAQRERRVEVDQPRLASSARSISWSAYSASLSRSGPARLTWNVCGRRPPWNAETSLTLTRRSG